MDEVETEIHTIATTTYWDPTEATATRPLAFMDHTVETPATYFYTHDLTKDQSNIIKIIELTEAENDEVNSILLTWTIDSIHSQLGLFASRV